MRLYNQLIVLSKKKCLVAEMCAHISFALDKDNLVHGRKLIIHWPRAKVPPLINRSVNQPPEVIIHC